MFLPVRRAMFLIPSGPDEDLTTPKILAFYKESSGL